MYKSRVLNSNSKSSCITFDVCSVQLHLSTQWLPVVNTDRAHTIISINYMNSITLTIYASKSSIHTDTGGILSVTTISLQNAL